MLLGIRSYSASSVLQGCHLLWRTFPGASSRLAFPKCVPRPRVHSRAARFRLFRFRSPLLTESRLISFPVSTEMCHFPTFAEHPPMDSEDANSDYSELGCPIRRSPDKLVCSTPGLIAAYHVLHRLSAPRHPPYTLSNLSTLIRVPAPCVSVTAAHSLMNIGLRRLAAKQLGRPRNNLSATINCS